MKICQKCASQMNDDEAAMNYKLINRNATEFLCPECLGKVTGCGADGIREMLLRFRRQGCTLFSPYREDEEQEK